MVVESERQTLVSTIRRLRVDLDGGFRALRLFLKTHRTDSGIDLPTSRETEFYTRVAPLSPPDLLPRCFDAVDGGAAGWHVLLVLAEMQRVLAPTGLLLLYDWIRQPLAAYLAWRREVLREGPAESQRRGFRLFPVHNKYTAEDWRWLLAEAGFQVRAETLPRAVHRLFVAVPSSRATSAR